jgi:2-phosphoglycerate kinase
MNENNQSQAYFRMRNWVRFLHQQARKKNIPIIDTSKVTLEA